MANYLVTEKGTLKIEMQYRQRI